MAMRIDYKTPPRRTNLKHDIFMALNECCEKNACTADIVESMFQAALPWIEKALRDGSEMTFTNKNGLMSKVQDIYVEEWMKENGIAK